MNPRRRVVLAELSQVESAFPLASAYLSNYARAHAESRAEWELVIRPFHVSRSAEEISGAIAAEGADLVTFSCYTWNMRLVSSVLSRLSRIEPRPAFLLGGPQVLGRLERYVSPEREDVFVCNGEGENTFVSFLDARACSRPDYAAVPGLSFFSGGAPHTTAAAPQVELDRIPSPFLESPFDADTYFVHYLWETNRGCPYHCTFCVWGKLQDSIAKFDIERLKAEITWLARRQYMSLHICDANFGMLPRDLELVEHIARCKRDFGVPFIIGASHAKSQPERLVRMTQILTDAGIRANAASALQSLDDATLVGVKRRNSGSAKLAVLQDQLSARDLGSIVEVIWPLPGETLASFRHGWDRLAELGVGSVICYPLMLLPATEMSAQREELGLSTVWDPSDVREVEWVVATRDVSRSEYEAGLWLYVAFMLLYNARALYYTLTHLRQDRGVLLSGVLEAAAELLRSRRTPLSVLCRKVVEEQAPSLDGGTFGTLFGYGLHEHRAEVDSLVLELGSALRLWDEPLTRALLEIDLLARPFPYKNASLFRTPEVGFEQVEFSARGRALVCRLAEETFRWLGPHVEVGDLEGPWSGYIAIDHERDQPPYMPQKSADEAGYLLNSLMSIVRSICPRFSACDAEGRPLGAAPK